MAVGEHDSRPVPYVVVRHAGVCCVFSQQAVKTDVAIQRIVPRSMTRGRHVTCSTSSLFSILDALGCGAVIASPEGVIQAGNMSAKKMLQTMRQAHAAASGPDRLSRRFMAMLEANAPKPVSIALTGPRPWVARKLPFGPSEENFLLVCVDLNRPGTVQAEWLRGIFGMTDCEARLAAQLFTGVALRDIATRREIGIGTLRAQLKSVFVKTGTNRQPELVALLSRLGCLNDVTSLTEHS